MAAVGENPFALASPRRPSTDDVDPTLVNDDGTTGYIAAGFPYADQINTALILAKVLAGMGAVASIEVHFAAGVPSIYAVQALDDTLVAGDFTVTDNGAGDTTITWAADTFPIAAASPTAQIVDTAHGSWLAPTCSSPANGVRVKTRADGGALTDCNFIVHIR